MTDLFHDEPESAPESEEPDPCLSCHDPEIQIQATVLGRAVAKHVAEHWPAFRAVGWREPGQLETRIVEVLGRLRP